MKSEKEIRKRREMLERMANHFDDMGEIDSARFIGERVLELDWVLEEQVPKGEIIKRKQK